MNRQSVEWTKLAGEAVHGLGHPLSGIEVAMNSPFPGMDPYLEHPRALGGRSCAAHRDDRESAPAQARPALYRVDRRTRLHRGSATAGAVRLDSKSPMPTCSLTGAGPIRQLSWRSRTWRFTKRGLRSRRVQRDEARRNDRGSESDKKAAGPGHVSYQAKQAGDARAGSAT